MRLNWRARRAGLGYLELQELRFMARHASYDTMATLRELQYASELRAEHSGDFKLHMRMALQDARRHRLAGRIPQLPTKR